MTHFCPKCRYDLTGLAANRCPECGGVFDPIALARQQSIHRPRWWVALLAVLVCAYAPFATWIPFQPIVEWYMIWPIAPGFFFGALLHPREPLEFIVMGLATVVILVGAWRLASRRWWVFALVLILLTAWCSFNSWGAYAAMRM